MAIGIQNEIGVSHLFFNVENNVIIMPHHAIGHYVVIICFKAF